ncbi:hypothetical protein RRG08_049296 [Elysia crispata]|uniref:Uncharacterized protein n=1 Tax=Elysia crispata TaxID=231223 RepID=A0AAE1B180_9GAST|nr:hypothetical protein RRG08_049296 [Elysia crispata]
MVDLGSKGLEIPEERIDMTAAADTVLLGDTYLENSESEIYPSAAKWFHTCFQVSVSLLLLSTISQGLSFKSPPFWTKATRGQSSPVSSVISLCTMPGPNSMGTSVTDTPPGKRPVPSSQVYE